MCLSLIKNIKYADVKQFLHIAVSLLWDTFDDIIVQHLMTSFL